MMDIFLFWDNQTDSPKILAEDGRFYFYSEDDIEIIQTSGKQGRHWTVLESLTDITPLNQNGRYDIFDSKLNEWISCYEVRKELWQQVQKLAGVIDWKDVY